MHPTHVNASVNLCWLELMMHKGKLRSTGDSGYESCLQDAIKGLEDGTFLTILEAARKSRVHCRLYNVGGTSLINLLISGGTSSRDRQPVGIRQPRRLRFLFLKRRLSLLSGVVSMGLLKSL